MAYPPDELFGDYKPKSFFKEQEIKRITFWDKLRLLFVKAEKIREYRNGIVTELTIKRYKGMLYILNEKQEYYHD